jgi:RNA polymerase sigma factor (sigma-70 family)
MQPLTSEQQEIVLQNTGLVYHFIEKFTPPRFIRMPDYEGELMLALCKAVITWNPEGGAALSTWAFHKFMGARSDIIRRGSKFFRNEKQTAEDKFGEIKGPDFNPCDQFELTPFQLECLRSRVDALEDHERILISQDHTAREIADSLGVSPQNIHHRRRVLLRKLAFRLRQVFPKQFRREHQMGNGGVSIPDNPHGDSE